MKITYNAAGSKRKELVNAIAKLLAVAAVYQGPPSFAYEIAGCTVDRDGNLFTPEEASSDEVFRLVDALIAEYGYTPEEPLSELFPEEDGETDDGDETEAVESALEEDEDADDGDTEDEAEDSDEEPETEAPEEPEPAPADAPQIAPVAGDSPTGEDDTGEAIEAPENGDDAPETGEEAAGDEAAEATPETEESNDSNESEDTDETRLTLSLPRKKFSVAAIERLKALVSSKKTLLKKVFDAEDLPIIVTDDQIQFPWFKLQGIDGEIDTYAKFIYLMAKRALTSSRISSYEKPTDNDKFTMRLFLNNLGFKGEEFKFARRFLVRNLEGNGAWRHGNAPDNASVDLEMPTVVTPTANSRTAEPTNAAEQPLKEEPEGETDVGDGEEESTDEG